MNFSIFQPVFLIKIVTLIILLFYIVFTFIVFAQIQAMGRIIGLPHASAIFKAVIFVNFILAVSLFVLAIVIL
jgi:hypothetical protein